MQWRDLNKIHLPRLFSLLPADTLKTKNHPNNMGGFLKTLKVKKSNEANSAKIQQRKADVNTLLIKS
jgi:hypothetical protein